jgi:hypothetical protein
MRTTPLKAVGTGWQPTTKIIKVVVAHYFLPAFGSAILPQIK